MNSTKAGLRRRLERFATNLTGGYRCHTSGSHSPDHDGGYIHTPFRMLKLLTRSQDKTPTVLIVTSCGPPVQSKYYIRFDHLYFAVCSQHHCENSLACPVPPSSTFVNASSKSFLRSGCGLPQGITYPPFISKVISGAKPVQSSVYAPYLGWYRRG
jgi:hypothetical protein